MAVLGKSLKFIILTNASLKGDCFYYSMVNITFLPNSALSCDKRWLESLPTFFQPNLALVEVFLVSEKKKL